MNTQYELCDNIVDDFIQSAQFARMDIEELYDINDEEDEYLAQLEMKTKFLILLEEFHDCLIDRVPPAIFCRWITKVVKPIGMSNIQKCIDAIFNGDFTPTIYLGFYKTIVFTNAHVRHLLLQNNYLNSAIQKCITKSKFRNMAQEFRTNPTNTKFDDVVNDVYLSRYMEKFI